MALFSKSKSNSPMPKINQPSIDDFFNCDISQVPGAENEEPVAEEVLETVGVTPEISQAALERATAEFDKKLEEEIDEEDQSKLQEKEESPSESKEESSQEDGKEEPSKEDEGEDSELDKLNKDLERKDEEIIELKSHIQRLQADFDNFRKQGEKQKQDLIRYANEGLIVKFLDIYEDMERALENSTNEEELREGLELIYSKMKNTLEKEGVEI